MAFTESETFVCPACDAVYKVVRLDVGPTSERMTTLVRCLSCGRTMPGADGTEILKYFLWRTAPRTN
jgi:predicted Zn finger-like uncharacterized protein